MKERCFIALPELDKEQGTIFEELSVAFCGFFCHQDSLFSGKDSYFPLLSAEQLHSITALGL